MSHTNDTSLRTSEHFGSRLRARREGFGLSVSDLAEVTHIGEGFLTAIEALDEAALPAVGYTLGFVRTYAKALGLDGDMAVKEYKADTAMTRVPVRDAPHLILRRQMRLPRGFVSAMSVAIVFLLIGAWYGTQSEAIATPIPMVDISAQYTAAEPAAPEMQEGLFTLRATAPSWIEVRDVQGTVTVSRIFVIGETWQGQTAAGYSVSVRDAGAVELYDGPKRIGPLGARGTPIANLTLSREDSSPQPAEFKSAELP